MAHKGGAIDFSSEKDKLRNWETYLLEFDRYSTTLSANLTISATAVSGDDVTLFPNQGYLYNDGEIIQYSNKTGGAPGAFEVSVRGCFRTPAVSAASGAEIREPLDKYWGTKTGILPGDIEGISDDRAVMDMPEGIKGRVNPDEGKASISNINVSLLNKSDQVSSMVSMVPMKNRKATLWAGYENLHADDYEKEFVGLVKDWEPDSKLLKYKFSIGDLRRSYRTSLFTQIGKTKLNGGINNVVTTIPVNSTAAASAGDRKFTDPGSGYDIDTYLRINDEILGPVTAMSATGFTVNGRGVFGTIAAAHSDDDDVNEAIGIDSRNPITFLLQILTSTGASSNGDYDVLPVHCGFGINEDLIDVVTFETERDDWTGPYTIGFFLDETEGDGKAWIEKELLRLIGGYMISLRSGLISLRMYHRQALASSRQLDIDDIRQVVNYNPGHLQVLNQILTQYSKNPYNGVYRELWEQIDVDSISKHGSSPLLTVSFNGVHGEHSLFDSTLDGLNILADYTTRMLARYGNPPPEVTLRLSPKHRDLDTGDLVAVTHKLFPNSSPATGDNLTGIGVEIEEYEVIARKFNYAKENQYVEIDALRAIFAEGATEYLNYLYQQYLFNIYIIIKGIDPPFTTVNTGVCQYWDSNRFTLTANKIRLRALMSLSPGDPVNGTIRGTLKLTDGTYIYSDSTIAQSTLPNFPTQAWQTFEFTPGASEGKIMLWIGIHKASGINPGSTRWASFNWDLAGVPDLVADSHAATFNSNPASHAILTHYTTQDLCADVAEKLI
ncbi:MAG: hypothetical protein KAJ19_00450 [Gammaproteobacteria bacterium]|nr:hypothetical protein [Gammaproteobacteria bacterium]